MIDETTNVISKIISIFTISKFSNIQMIVDSIDAKFRNILFFVEIDLNDEIEYQCLKRTEKKFYVRKKCSVFALAKIRIEHF